MVSIWLAWNIHSFEVASVHNVLQNKKALFCPVKKIHEGELFLMFTEIYNKLTNNYNAILWPEKLTEQ